MIRTIAPMLACVLALFLGGCGGSPYTGEWVVDKDTMREQMIENFDAENTDMPPSMRELALKTANNTLDQMNTTMMIESDGTFTITSTMLSQTQTVTGTWSAADGEITMSPATGTGQRSVGRIRGGKLVIDNPSGMGPKETVLKRS